MTKKVPNTRTAASYVLAMCVLAGTVLGAQVITQRQGTATNSAKPAATPTPTPTPTPVVPPTYVINPGDVLRIDVRGEAELTGDYLVRPDGKITMLQLNDIQAAGLTPEQLKESITRQSQKIIQLPSVTVIVKQITPPKVYITGTGISRAGEYPLADNMDILQLITIAGGVLEFADEENIQIIRDNKSIRVNYKDLRNGRNIDKFNIKLRPGDRVIVSGGQPLSIN